MNNVVCYDSNDKELKHLYQWDINQTVTIRGVNPTFASEVHFCNQYSDKALVVKPSIFKNDIIADIPNVLLQQASPILAYLYQTTEDSGRTIHFIQIPIKARMRPSDYVYTETDVLSYAALDERIAILEKYSGVGDISIVWSVNGMTGDVFLTPEDIGAMPKDAIVVNALSNFDIERLISGSM